MAFIENNGEIPYLTTAEAVTVADGSYETFLLSIFPAATLEQLELFRLYTLGKLHDGIIIGLEMTGYDPIGEVEAYQIGVQEGLERKKEL